MRVTFKSRLQLQPVELEIITCFLSRREHWSTQRKTSWSKDESQQQNIQATYEAKSGNALVTMPSLLLNKIIFINN